jgi:hypothetical protein
MKSRIVHMLVLHKFLVCRNAANKQCKSLQGYDYTSVLAELCLVNPNGNRWVLSIDELLADGKGCTLTQCRFVC